MNMKNHSCLLIVLLTLLSVWARAQVTTMPYICGFEQDEDLSAWHLNSGTSAAMDQWIYGTATHSEGRRSLYISTNNYDAQYGHTPNIVAAYFTIKFPTATRQENYDLSFDWKCNGASTDSKLYMYICPEQFLTDASASNVYNLSKIVSTTSGTLPATVTAICQKFGSASLSYLQAQESWQNISLTNEIKVSAKNSAVNFAVVFLWVNPNTNDKISNLGICIDNVQVGSARVKKPQNLSVVPQCMDSTMLITWESALNNFIIEYRSIGSSTWRRTDGLNEDAMYITHTGNVWSYPLQRIVEGSYDVRVKGSLNNDTSMYTYQNSILVYCPDNHCINYLDLNSPNLVCTYGWTEDYTSKHGTPYDNIGYIDFGPDAKESRHTIHTDPTEVDPRTDSLLHTVPAGALGAVRLGNWNTSGEAESMTYSFVVDSATQGILIIKYAVVLNKPNESCGDPGFRMVVLDENDNEIDEYCGKADFSYTSAKAAGWNETKAGDIVWKDWTSVGVNLQPYNGQTLKVQLTTRDCGGGGHYGYAYFTLDCASAYIETENCGKDATISCKAPDGFAYKWFDETGKVVSTKQQLEVDAGLHTYTCRVSFVEDSTCYFEVSTTSAPRFPVPEFTWEPVYDHCTSKIRFFNHAHVMNFYEGYEKHNYSEACDDSHWYFTRLSDRTTTESYNWNPVYTCKNEGDTIVVSLTAYIGENNLCDSTRTDTIVMPNIQPQDSTIRATICEGEAFFFDGLWRDKDSTYVVANANFAGCDSIATLYLTVNPKSPETNLVDSICSTDKGVNIGGVYYKVAGHYEVWLKNTNGCDSIVNLDLTVNEKMIADADTMGIQACADNGSITLDFSIMAGKYDSLVISFDDPAIPAVIVRNEQVQSVTIPYSADIAPKQYVATLNFHQFCCGVLSLRVPFEIRFRSSVIEQKWNDVLTLLNSKYNGGYTFESYQWYKDGQLLEGETGSYLYQPLDTNSYYHVVLTRNDGVSRITISTCDFRPTVHVDKYAFPTVVSPAQKVPARFAGKTHIRMIDLSGNVVSEHDYPKGDVQVEMPVAQGWYIMELTSDNQHITQKIIVQL